MSLGFSDKIAFYVTYAYTWAFMCVRVVVKMALLVRSITFGSFGGQFFVRHCDSITNEFGVEFGLATLDGETLERKLNPQSPLASMT